MERPQYINWIVREDSVVFEDQQPLNCYRLSYEIDDNILEDWALHIRRHYVPDDELEEDVVLHKLTVEEYLRQYVVPQKGEAFGPTARSNDISEILFADLFEFALNYEVPRCKQYNRSGKNESEHGTDVIAYRFFDNSTIKISIGILLVNIRHFSTSANVWNRVLESTHLPVNPDCAHPRDWSSYRSEWHRLP